MATAAPNPQRRKRVLFLSPTPAAGGGAERVLLDHARFLDRRRFEPFFAILGPGSLVAEAQALGIETHVASHHTESRPLGMARELYRFGAFVRRRGIDVIVGNKYRSILYWGLTGARSSSFVWLLHDPLEEQGLMRRAVAHTVERMPPSFTVWVTPMASESYSRRFPRHFGANTATIFPGTSPEDLRSGADARRARERWGISEHAPVLSVFARMQASKGHLDLVRAAPKILSEHPDARILLCGGVLPGMPVDYQAAVHATIRELGLERRVLCLGMISEEEKKDVLALTTILVHPAHWEPFGIAVIEGMAVGKPVVVADASGPALSVEHGVTGLVVPKGNSDKLAEALLELLGDTPRAAALGAKGAEVVNVRHHSRVATLRLEEILNRVTDENSAVTMPGA